jgi:hypothetical protein
VSNDRGTPNRAAPDANGDPLDADLGLITEYLANELSPEQAAAVEERLAEDEAFYEMALPYMRLWSRRGDYRKATARHKAERARAVSAPPAAAVPLPTDSGVVALAERRSRFPVTWPLVLSRRRALSLLAAVLALMFGLPVVAYRIGFTNGEKQGLLERSLVPTTTAPPGTVPPDTAPTSKKPPGTNSPGTNSASTKAPSTKAPSTLPADARNAALAGQEVAAVPIGHSLLHLRYGARFYYNPKSATIWKVVGLNGEALIEVALLDGKIELSTPAGVVDLWPGTYAVRASAEREETLVVVGSGWATLKGGRRGPDVKLSAGEFGQLKNGAAPTKTSGGADYPALKNGRNTP